MVDVTELINYLFAVLAAAGGVLGIYLAGLAARWIKQKTGIDLEANHRLAIEQAFNKAVSFGIEAARTRLPPSATRIEIENTALRLGAQYAAEAVPSAIEYFGLTPDRLAEMMRARLGERTGPPALPPPQPPGSP